MSGKLVLPLKSLGSCDYFSPIYAVVGPQGGGAEPLVLSPSCTFFIGLAALGFVLAKGLLGLANRIIDGLGHPPSIFSIARFSWRVLT